MKENFLSLANQFGQNWLNFCLRCYLILLQSLLTHFENLNLFFCLFSTFVHRSFNFTFTWKHATVWNKKYLWKRFQDLCQQKLFIHTFILKLMTFAAARRSLQNLESYINITKYSETYLLLGTYRYHRISFPKLSLQMNFNSRGFTKTLNKLFGRMN